jgi:UrcA family protein
MESAMKTLLVALAPLLLSLPAAVFAEPALQRPVAVTAAGLDLSTPDGAAAMLARVRGAVDRACTFDRKWDRYSDDDERCRADAASAIVDRLQAPLVTALYRGEATPELLAAVK